MKQIKKNKALDLRVVGWLEPVVEQTDAVVSVYLELGGKSVVEGEEERGEEGLESLQRHLCVVTHTVEVVLAERLNHIPDVHLVHCTNSDK